MVPSQDLAGVNGPNTHTMQVDVVEQIFGAAISSAVVEVVQSGFDGELPVCGGLHWSSVTKAALILYPTSIDNVYRLAPHSFGWGVEETPGVYRSGDGATFGIQDLVAIGGGL